MTGLPKHGLTLQGRVPAVTSHHQQWLQVTHEDTAASALQGRVTAAQQGEVSLVAAPEHGRIYRREKQNSRDIKISTSRKQYQLPLHSKNKYIFLYDFKLLAAATFMSASISLEKWSSRKHCQHLMAEHATLISLLNRINIRN